MAVLDLPSRFSGNRRRLLRCGLALVGMVAMPRLVRSEHARDETIPLAVRVAGLTCDDERALGHAAMQSEQDESRRRELEQLLCAAFGVQSEKLHWLAGLGDPDLRRKLQARIRLDFADGRIASVDGWWLAATEARLLELTTALLHPRSLVLQPWP